MNKRLIMFLILPFSLLFSQDYLWLLIQGDLAFGAQRYQDAAEFFRLAQVQNPDSIAPYLGLYHSELYAGNYQNAYSYAQTLYNKQASLINSERFVYTGGLCGDYNSVSKMLEGIDLWNNRESLFEQAGRGFYIGKYFFEAAKISKAGLNYYPQNDVFKERLDYSEKNIGHSPFGVKLYNSFFKYSGKSNYKDGIFTQLNLDLGTIEHKFNFAVSSQKVKGKADLKFIANIFRQDTVLDGVPQVFTYNYSDTTIYKAADLNQNELFFSYNHQFSSFYSIGAETKASFFKNDLIDNAQMLGINSDLYFKQFLLRNSLLLSKMNYYYAPEVTSYSTFITADNDTVHSVFRYVDYFANKMESSLNTLQFNTNILYTFQQLSFNADLTVLKLYNNHDIFKNYDKTYFYAELGASYLFSYFGLYGSYSTGDKFLLHQSANQYFNTAQNELKYTTSAGLIIYPDQGWSFIYNYKYQKNQDYKIVSNLIGLTYQF